MFGVEAEAKPKLTEHRLWWPGVWFVVGATCGLLAVTVFFVTGILWFAPLIAAPSLMILGIGGAFLPGITGVIGFDWHGYETWQLAIGAAWLLLTLVIPMAILALLATISFLAF